MKRCAHAFCKQDCAGALLTCAVNGLRYCGFCALEMNQRLRALGFWPLPFKIGHTLHDHFNLVTPWK